MLRPGLPDSFRHLPIAHRALHDAADGRPENSRAAVAAAVAAGYGIEIDLQLSSDGEPMVFHDYGLDRLTARQGTVRTLSADELGRIGLLHGTEGIPTLGEILQLVGGRVPLLVEIKDQDGAMGPNVGALEEAAASALLGYAGPLAVMSFNPHSVARMADLLPDTPRGLTTAGFRPESDWPPLSPAVYARLREIPDYDRVGASFVSHQWRDLEMPRVAELAAAGAEILCWTIRSPDQEAVARRHAANITFEGYAARIPA